MKQPASNTHESESKRRQDETFLEILYYCIAKRRRSENNEYEVCQSIYKLGNVWTNVIILFAPVNGRGAVESGDLSKAQEYLYSGSQNCGVADFSTR